MRECWCRPSCIHFSQSHLCISYHSHINGGIMLWIKQIWKANLFPFLQSGCSRWHKVFLENPQLPFDVGLFSLNGKRPGGYWWHPNCNMLCGWNDETYKKIVVRQFLFPAAEKKKYGKLNFLEPQSEMVHKPGCPCKHNVLLTIKSTDCCSASPIY